MVVYGAMERIRQKARGAMDRDMGRRAGIWGDEQGNWAIGGSMWGDSKVYVAIAMGMGSDG